MTVGGMGFIPERLLMMMMIVVIASMLQRLCPGHPTRVNLPYSLQLGEEEVQCCASSDANSTTSSSPEPRSSVCIPPPCARY